MDYTKGDVEERTVFFFYEARDAISDGLKIKDSRKTKSGRSLAGEKVWPINSSQCFYAFNLALEKAGLTKKDKRTKRCILHPHALRKFLGIN